MKHRYRIVTDAYAGYEVQVKKWYFPFWVFAGKINTFSTIEAAEAYANKVMRKVIKEVK